MAAAPVPGTKYCVPQDDIEWILRECRTMLEAGAYLTQGRHVAAFEQAFAAAHGVSHAVATSAGSSALECIVRGLDLAGSEVILPTNTFAATAYAVLHAGAIPVFADIGPDLCIDPDHAASLVNSRTRAIVAVHVGGLVSPGVEQLERLCGSKQLHLIEDAAQAHGASLNGRMAGSIGVAGAFSFFSTKLLAMGEGGAVTTRDPALDARVRLIRNQGKLRNENLHEIMGHNFRLTEFQAMLGLTQVGRMTDFIRRRTAIARAYGEAFSQIEGLAIRPVPQGCVANFYKYVLFLESAGAARRLKATCRHAAGVEFGGEVYRIPLHLQPVFHPWARGPLPIAEDLCPRHACPPIHSQMTFEEAGRVVHAIRAACHV